MPTSISEDLNTSEIETALDLLEARVRSALPDVEGVLVLLNAP